jgi:uncharacterized protein YjbI with pentapeptide repeats
LGQAQLIETDLTEANLHGANLRGANLTDANLENALLTDTFLKGVDLSTQSNLTVEQIESADIDKTTLLPEHLSVTWITEKTFKCRINEGANKKNKKQTKK